MPHRTVASALGVDAVPMHEEDVQPAFGQVAAGFGCCVLAGRDRHGGHTSIASIPRSRARSCPPISVSNCLLVPLTVGTLGQWGQRYRALCPSCRCGRCRAVERGSAVHPVAATPRWSASASLLSRARSPRMTSTTSSVCSTGWARSRRAQTGRRIGMSSWRCRFGSTSSYRRELARSHRAFVARARCIRMARGGAGCQS
jgi:hypothetical protein